MIALLAKPCLLTLNMQRHLSFWLERFQEILEHEWKCCLINSVVKLQSLQVSVYVCRPPQLKHVVVLYHLIPLMFVHLWKAVSMNDQQEHTCGLWCKMTSNSHTRHKYDSISYEFPQFPQTLATQVHTCMPIAQATTTSAFPVSVHIITKQSRKTPPTSDSTVSQVPYTVADAEWVTAAWHHINTPSGYIYTIPHDMVCLL